MIITFLSSLPEWQMDILLVCLSAIVAVWLIQMIRSSIRETGFFHEEIACAAIRYDDIGVMSLPAPARHHHVMWARRFVDGQRTPGSAAQGFVTTSGRFVDRVEGLRIATKRGQIEEKHGNPSELYSEDMWPTPPEARGYTISHVDD